jgi:superfamily II DNA or RNA helicase
MFWPTRQIGWQTDYIARMYVMSAAMLAADMGTGKSVMALGVAGLAFEQDAIDHVLVVCEPNKLADSEWPADFRRFTRIEAAAYHGPKRKKMLDALPPAIITTYETCRDDVAKFPPKGSKSRTPVSGPLMDALRGKRVLVIYDEITKLGRRTSNLYKAHHWMLTQLRKASPGIRVLGLSATPMDTDLENIFSEMRLVVPQAMPTVAEFERIVVKSRDPWGRPSYRPEGKEWFRQQCEPWILRKRKSDPDVRDLFPPFEESFRRIRMHADQYRIYQLLEDLAWDPETHEHRQVPGLGVLLRQLAGDPWAVLEASRTGTSELARMVAEEMGGELEKCSSAKAEELASIADLVMSSGGKLVVFSFFTTVLAALQKRLGSRPVYLYHGGLTDAEREHQKMLFKAHEGGAILLASDAGARGINLPWITYAVEYEAARTHALRQQRAGRGHRLGKLDPLTFITLVLDSSIEGTNAIRALMSRNADQDFILGDEGAEGYMTADDRREMFAQAKPRKAG